MKPIKLGVDTIKKSLGKLMKLARTIAEVWKDKKVKPTEWLTVGIAMTSVPGIISDADDAYKELKDLDPSEQLEIVNYFKEEFDIADDVLEQKIEDALTLVKDTYNLGKRWYDWADGLVPDESETPEAVEV